MKHFCTSSFIFLLLALGTLGAQNALTTTWRLVPNGRGNAEKIQQVGPNKFFTFGKSSGHAYAITLDAKGKQQTLKRYKNNITGIRSEFTDGLKNPDSYVFAGDCDGCDTAVVDINDRKILLVQTDTNLNVTKKVTIAPATNIQQRQYNIWGYQRIRKDGSGYILQAQYTHLENDTTKTDFSLTKLDANLNVVWHRAYDFHEMDNLGDIHVTPEAIYVMNWGITRLSIGTDTISLYKFNKNGDMQWEQKYTGTGLVMIPVGNDWVIGGSEMTNFLQGPQSMLLRVDGTTGAVKARTSWGGNLIDAVRDVKLLQNGNLLVLSDEDCDYPKQEDIDDFVQLYLWPTSFPHPKMARAIRMNASTFVTADQPSVFPNPQRKDILMRSILPVNNDGTQFLACGQFYRKSAFWSIVRQDYGAINGSADNSDLLTDDRSEAAPVQVSLSPNPVQSGGNLNLRVSGELGSAITAEVFDLNGRLVRRADLILTDNLQIAAPEKNGLYVVRIKNERQMIATTRFSVNR